MHCVTNKGSGYLLNHISSYGYFKGCRKETFSWLTIGHRPIKGFKTKLTTAKVHTWDLDWCQDKPKFGIASTAAQFANTSYFLTLCFEMVQQQLHAKCKQPHIGSLRANLLVPLQIDHVGVKWEEGLPLVNKIMYGFSFKSVRKLRSVWHRHQVSLYADWWALMWAFYGESPRLRRLLPLCVARARVRCAPAQALGRRGGTARGFTQFWSFIGF